MYHHMESTSTYNKNNPFLARISERFLLGNGTSQKNTFHLTLDIEGSGISYQIGDSIAIQPKNDPQIVDKTLMALRAKGDETVVDRQSCSFSLREFLSNKGNVAEVPRKLIGILAERQTDPNKKERLNLLISEGQKDILKEYQKAHEVWDTLAENQEVMITPQELCSILQPLLPRFYSIASSMRAVGNKVDLTVAELKYETNGQLRRGVCTNYLCRLVTLHDPVIPVYIQPNHGFTLPENDDAPIIMIGPGTGVAPYRGFMQERMERGAAGENWLFFGEWHRDTEFFYEEYWSELMSQGKLLIETAFSRDQEHKIYVQHRILEKGREIFDWLERGAYIYVCGDAHRMAKDVDAAIHQVIKEHGNFDENIAKEYVKRLKSEKRYLRDVY
ncbi:MAG: sulfite reductase [Parachlamydiaceae bacterium]